MKKFIITTLLVLSMLSLVGCSDKTSEQTANNIAEKHTQKQKEKAKSEKEEAEFAGGGTLEELQERETGREVIDREDYSIELIWDDEDSQKLTSGKDALKPVMEDFLYTSQRVEVKRLDFSGIYTVDKNANTVTLMFYANEDKITSVSVTYEGTTGNYDYFYIEDL
ncbi:hypothetical protein M2146_001051 [Lachnospiraceae bacterium PF1-22]